ncbi:hypothetical protein PoB_006858500, partial [Plakobranchus ocellatus]
FPTKVAELTSFLNEAAPFGQLRDTSADNTCARLADKFCTLPKGNKPAELEPTTGWNMRFVSLMPPRPLPCPSVVFLLAYSPTHSKPLSLFVMVLPYCLSLT